MNFFGKKKSRKSEEEIAPTFFELNGVFVVKTEIVSSYNDGRGLGPLCVTKSFLARKEGEDYYELFSNRFLQREETTHSDGMISKNFDVPYVTEAKPIQALMKNPNTKKMSSSSLFDFITTLNVYDELKKFHKK